MLNVTLQSYYENYQAEERHLFKFYASVNSKQQHPPRATPGVLHSTAAQGPGFILDDLPRGPAQGGYFHIGRSGGLAPKFASEILVGAPNFASKNISDKYPKFCPLNFRYDPKIGTFSQLLRLVVTELPKFFLLFCELDRTLPQILPPNFM